MVNKDNLVTFWNTSGEFGCFSNWKKSIFKVGEIEFYNMEQFIMYQKALLFGDVEVAEKILKEKNPKEIKKFGREVKNFNAEIWSRNLFHLCSVGMVEKFNQNPDMKNILISTGNKTIVEASPYDKIWGIGMSETDEDILNMSKWGENILGKMLCYTRNLINTGVV